MRWRPPGSSAICWTKNRSDGGAARFNLAGLSGCRAGEIPELCFSIWCQMKVIYFQDPRGNFGDELNRWLWSKLFGEFISGYGNHVDKSLQDYAGSEPLFYGIGTILDDRIPASAEKIIFGSGFGYGTLPGALHKCDIRFVRGPKTAAALGLPAGQALTDPAILLRHFFPLVPAQAKRFDVAFMPHHSTVAGDFWRRACTALNIHYIDPCGFDTAAVIEQIASSRLVIAEAMHGAIVADTFRVPWIPVTSVTETNSFKWQDWCGSLEMTYAPRKFTPIFCSHTPSLLKAALNAGKMLVRQRELRAAMNARSSAMLSDETLLNSRLQDMDCRVQQLRDHLTRQRNGEH